MITEDTHTSVVVRFDIRAMLELNISAREALTMFEIERSSTGLSGDIMRAVGLPCRNSYHSDIRKLEKRGWINRVKGEGVRGNTYTVYLTAQGYDRLNDLLHGLK